MGATSPRHVAVDNGCAAGCPLEAVDRRLNDLHQQWHQAENVYFTPERFRIAIQSAIQTARTVTFILQNQKRAIPDFENWYGSWQERLKNDCLMRWMVDARNKIEKQGDLEMHSSVRAQIIASYLDEGPRIEVPAKLFDAPWKLIKSIPKHELEHVKNHGTLRIERRWVENSLPEFELLEAVAQAYGRISEVVHDAHRQMGLPSPVTTNTDTGEVYTPGFRGGRLPCMIGHSDTRALDLSLRTGRPQQFEEKRLKVDFSRAGKLEKRYGTRIEDVIPKDAKDEEHVLESLFAVARKMFLHDGFLDGLYFLLRERKIIQVLNLRPESHGQKYLMMRNLAHDVTKVGADAIICLSEVWVAPFEADRPNQRAEDSPRREEALEGILARKEGEPVGLTAKIRRESTKLSLGETEVQRDAMIYSFAPIYEAWGRLIPEHWLNPAKATPDGINQRQSP